MTTVTKQPILGDPFDASLLIDPKRGWILNYSFTALLAGTIAGLGMRLDSAPIVIGAMLVAPVMRPVLGMAFALLSDVEAKVYWRLAAILAATVASLVALGVVLAKLVPSTELILADEVLARTAPDVRDLLVALAAGAVGAFAILRPKVSETIPGVAIAVALVPPLVACGIALAESFTSQATGALLLFATNLVAIIAGATVTTLALRTAGAATFVLDRRRLTASSVIVLSIGIVLAASLTGAFASAVAEARDDRDRSANLSQSQQQQAAARQIIEPWLLQSDQPTLSLVSIELPIRDGVPTVEIVLIGSEDAYVPPLVYGNRGEQVSVEEQLQELLGPLTALRVRVTAVSDELDSRFDDEGSISADVRAELLRAGRSSTELWLSDAGIDGEVTDVRVDDDGEVLITIASPEALQLDDLGAAVTAVLRESLGVRFIVDTIESPTFLGPARAESFVLAVDGAELNGASACAVAGSDRVRLAADGVFVLADADGLVAASSAAVATAASTGTTVGTEQRSYQSRFESLAPYRRVDVVVAGELEGCNPTGSPTITVDLSGPIPVRSEPDGAAPIVGAHGAGETAIVATGQTAPSDDAVWIEVDLGVVTGWIDDGVIGGE